MSPLRVLVADDEPLARQVVTQLLRRDPEIGEIQECPDGPSALAALRATPCDIAFIDVEMPEMTGLEVALRAGAGVGAVVFTTAYSQYAVQAFDIEAADYLLKPFSDGRFADALERAKRRSRAAERRRQATGTTVVDGERYLTRVPVPEGAGSRLLPVREILWIEAQDYYVNLHTAGRTHLVRATLASFERRLDPARFVRVHRSALVNLDKVVRVEGHDGVTLVLADDTRLEASRARRRQVRQALVPVVRD